MSFLARGRGEAQYMGCDHRRNHNILLDRAVQFWKRAAVFRRLIQVLALLILIALTLLMRSVHWKDVFYQGRVFFTEADAYARMSRVQAVQENYVVWPLPEHLFENWPDGTRPHTTLPMDWTILGMKGAVHLLGFALPEPWNTQKLDIAGAAVSPFLALLTLLFLWWWTRRVSGQKDRLRLRWPSLILFALSPALAHAQELGRPDHQAFLVLLLALALGFEWLLIDDRRDNRRRWAVLAGISWGLALWVSLYEPLILLAAVMLAKLPLLRQPGRLKPHLFSLALGLGVFGAAAAYEGINIQVPAGEDFNRWRQFIGELQSVSPFSNFIWHSAGWSVAVLPFLLLLRRRLWPILALLLLTWGLTCWQLRWNACFGLVAVMGFGLVDLNLKRRWWKSVTVAVLTAVSLWPILREWDSLVFENPGREQRKANTFYLRVAALSIKGEGGILAPWWDSPALAYWTGEPAVAGSSHESLPGILDTARFFLSDDPDVALAILKKREVRWVVCGLPSNVIPNSEGILVAQAPKMPMARLLFETPLQAPMELQYVWGNELFKVFEFRGNQ